MTRTTFACLAAMTLMLVPVGGTASAQTLTAKPAALVKAVVGTCNTTKGCNVLKRTCKKAKGSYNKGSGKGGLKGSCTKDTAKAVKPGAKLAADVAPQKHAYCHTAAFCKSLKKTCESSGGKYKPLTKGGGVCKD